MGPTSKIPRAFACVMVTMQEGVGIAWPTVQCVLLVQVKPISAIFVCSSILLLSMAKAKIRRSGSSKVVEVASVLVAEVDGDGRITSHQKARTIKTIGCRLRKHGCRNPFRSRMAAPF